MNANDVRTKLKEILDNTGNNFDDLAALVQQLHNNIQSQLNNEGKPGVGGQTED